MARYLNEEQAAADGFLIAHEPESARFALYRTGASAHELLGEAHYSLRGDTVIDFDHTEVHPSLRGTGLAALLARRALTSEITHGRRTEASCWFIAGYLDKHPELRSS